MVRHAPEELISSEPSGTLRERVAAMIAADAEAITLRWVSILTERLGVEPERALPTRSILDHIPSVLRATASSIADPSDPLLDQRVRKHLSQLADLRRSQGFSISEVLAEFRILSGLIEDTVEEVITRSGEWDVREVVQLVRHVRDAVLVLGEETARRFQQWHARAQEERVGSLIGYTAMLSHELGNRLGAADTALDMLLSDEVDLSMPKVRRVLRLARESIASGLRTVQDVRVLATYERSEERKALRQLPLATVVHEVVRQMRVSASSAHLRLHLSGQMPEMLVDAERLPLVLTNLIGNAIKHHDRSDGHNTVRVTIATVDTGVRIAVNDDGPGVPSTLRERMFEAGVTSGAGSGFGLAIAREAVDQMGGGIDVEHGDDRGVTFLVTLPRDAVGRTATSDPA